MYPCARRVGSADPTNQSENRSDVRSLVSRRKRLLGYMVLQPVASCQPGYPATQTSSDEEDGHAQGPLMSVPVDPYGPRRKRRVAARIPLGDVNAHRQCLSTRDFSSVSQAASIL